MLRAGELPDTFSPCDLKVASVDGVQTASHFYYGGFRATVRITLQDGRVIEGTPNHRIKVANQYGYGWKRLDEITQEDFVAVRLGAGVWASENPRFDDFRPSKPSGSQKPVRIPDGMTPELGRLL
ncbi:MAG: hypothetical protein RMM51_12505, partial [Verrucomicrobiae bacterium]|nr:hypothetical protein [Verrucomicrobiae bacterium]